MTDSAVDPVTGDPFEVRVRRSTRRRRTVGAVLRGGVLEVALPSWMSKAEEDHWVAEMSARFRRRQSTDRIDLVRRAARLAVDFGLPVPSDIGWSDTMTARWGSCAPATGAVRLSTRLAPFPDWVIDYVIVHELAHIVHPDHSAAFWELVARYPRTERAVGYLIAKSGDADPDSVD